MVLRGVRLPATARACRLAGRCRTSRGTATSMGRSRPCRSRITCVWGSYHYENNDGNGWSWGSEPAWDTTMTYGVQDQEPHRCRAVAVVPDRHDGGEREVPRVLEGRPALSAQRPPGPSWVHQLVEVGRLWHQRRLPVRRYAEGEPADDSGRPLALHRAVPRPARHQVRRAVHEGPGQPAGRLLPELRELPLPVPLDAERRRNAELVRRHRASLLQLQGHDQSVPDGPDRPTLPARSSTTGGRRPSA